MLVVAISSDIYAPNKSIGSVFLIKLARNYLHKLSWNLLRFYLAVQACGEVIYVCIAAGLPNEQYAFICQTYIIWVNTSIDFAEYFKIRRPTVVCRNSYNIIRIIFNIYNLFTNSETDVVVSYDDIVYWFFVAGNEYWEPACVVIRLRGETMKRNDILFHNIIYVNRWEICLSMREQNDPRKCVEYTQRVFAKRRNCVNIAKCLVQNKWLFYVENGHDLN
jgi:hypothetical protein